MNEDRGMLFVFSRSDFYVFWMEEMLFPLDIIWVNEDREVVDYIEDVEPDTYPEFQFVNDFLAKYVLEVNAGFIQEHGIKTGDEVKFSLEEI